MSMERLSAIFRDTFDDQSLVLRPDLEPKEVKGWDSFNHINLVLAIEGAFGFSFTTAEIKSVKTVGQLVELLRSKGLNVTW
jgi:acyl carrier protein